MFPTFNLLTLAERSFYFGAFARYHAPELTMIQGKGESSNKRDYKQHTLQITFPDTVSYLTCLRFLLILQTQPPFVSRLLTYVSIPDLFTLCEFFIVDCIHVEIHNSYSRDLRVAPQYLYILIHNYGLSHPATFQFLQRVSDSFLTPYYRILDILEYPANSNLQGIIDYLRHQRRAMLYNSRPITSSFCCVCENIIYYHRLQPHAVRYAALTPCCGSPLHTACVVTLKKYLFSCPVCSTDLWQGKPDMRLESTIVTGLRHLHRQQNGIDTDIQLPKL